jgi:hypothetical protein
MNFEQWANVILENHMIEQEDGSLLVEEGYEEYIDTSLLSESIYSKRVIRKGKPKIEFHSTNKDYKVIKIKGKPVERKLTPKEKMNRKKSQMGASKKRAQTSKAMTKKRLATMGLKSKDNIVKFPSKMSKAA